MRKWISEWSGVIVLCFGFIVIWMAVGFGVYYDTGKYWGFIAFPVGMLLVWLLAAGQAGVIRG